MNYMVLLITIVKAVIISEKNLGHTPVLISGIPKLTL